MSLPSFDNPPLEEVVLGAQFSSPEGFNSTHNGQVWGLFGQEFPIVQDQPRLEPQFEVFGGQSPQQGIRLDFGPPPLRNRLWFVSNDQSHLLQFQDDRLLLNWRKRKEGEQYPRYETISDKFSEYLGRLDSFYSSKYQMPLRINQAEISYINIIPMENYREIGELLSLVRPSSVELEGINANFGEVIRRDTKPVARITYELQSVSTVDGRKRALRLSLTYRGKPLLENIDSTLDFISNGRDLIVKRFCDITTSKAHGLWQRTS